MRATVSVHPRLAIAMSVAAIVGVVGALIAACMVMVREPTAWLAPVDLWQTGAWFALDSVLTIGLAWAAWKTADVLDAWRGGQTVKS